MPLKIEPLTDREGAGAKNGDGGLSTRSRWRSVAP